MPQLDLSSFPSQLFWLAITFALLYLIMAKAVLPQITSVLQGRQDRISSDLEKADHMKAEAERMEEEYNSSLENTRSKASAIIAKAVTKAEEFSKKKHSELDAVLAKKAEEADKMIAGAKEQAIKEMTGISADLVVMITDKLTKINVSKNEASERVAKLLKDKIG